MASTLERYFSIRERGSTVRTEVLGGVVTFLTMAYIVFVNPAILSAAGLPFDAVAVAHGAGRGDLHARDGPADEPAVRAGLAGSGSTRSSRST